MTKSAPRKKSRRATLAERHATNLRRARGSAGLSPEQLAAIAWPDVVARTTGGARVRAIETGRYKLSSPFADDIARALKLDVSFFGAPVAT